MSQEVSLPQTVNRHLSGSSAAHTPLAHEQGDHFGRSPDLRVIAWPNLPIALNDSGIFRLHSPLTVAGAVMDLALFTAPHHIPYYPKGEPIRPKCLYVNRKKKILKV